MERPENTEDFISAGFGIQFNPASSRRLSSFSDGAASACSLPTTGDASSLEAFEDLGTHSVSAPALLNLWSPQDERLAKMFQSWDCLPFDPERSSEDRHVILSSMEALISPFEEAINHSDEGFRQWILRHQRAMDLGLSPEPDWPKLKDERGVWSNERWITRYGYVVKKREQLIAERREEDGITTPFRGLLAQRPARTMGLKKAQPNSDKNYLPTYWAQPVAEHPVMEAQCKGGATQQNVVGLCAGQLASAGQESPPALTDMSSPSELSSPLWVPSTTSWIYPLAGSGSPTSKKGGRSVRLDAIKIDSDSE